MQNKRGYVVDLNKRVWQWIVLVALAFIWGTSFILMKKALRSFTYNQVAGFRVFISFIVLLPVAIKRLKKVHRRHIKSLLIVGFIGNAIPAFLFTKAQTQISSSLAGMLNTIVPFFTLIIGALIYRSYARFMQIVGIIVGLLGAAGLIFQDVSTLTIGNNLYAFFVVIATLCYAFNLNEIKFRLQELDGITITSIAFMFVGPVAGIYLLSTNLSHSFRTPDAFLNFGYAATLALFGSVIAVVGFNTLIKYTSPLFAASVTYIIPVFAILWGVFDGEIITIIDITCIAITLLGVYLVNRKPDKRLLTNSSGKCNAR